MLTSQVLVTLMLVAPSIGYKMYQDALPNGALVPHPCKPNYLWQGLGHLVPAGGGTRNQFGLDFLKNGKVFEAILILY